MSRCRCVRLSALVVASVVLPSLCLAATPREQGLRIELLFSTDSGRTFVADPPVLDEPGSFIVRTKLFCDLEGRSAYMPQLSAPVDFASADKGRQKWSKHWRWYQSAPKPWYNADAEYFDLTVRTDARGEGVMGKKNSWQDGKFVDAPLPECDALPAGETVFLLSVAIRVGKERIVAEKRFPVIHKHSPTTETAKNTTQADPQGESGQQEVYVSTSGDDDNPGMADAPLRSVRQALAQVAPGGTIHIAAGIYREGQLEITRGGTPSSPLLIEGAGAESTRILGSVEVGPWKPHAPGVWKVEGFTTNTQQVFCDGRHLQQIGARTPWNEKILWADQVCLPAVGKGLDDLVPNSFFQDGKTNTLYVMLSDRSDPNGHRMEASLQPSILRGSEASYVTIRNLTFGHTNGTYNGGRGTVVSLGKSHWTLEDCVVEYGDFRCVGASGRHHTIRRCTIRYGGDVGVESGNTDAAHGWAFYEDAPAEHTTIEDCRIVHNNYRGFFAAWHGGGMKLIPASRAVTIRRCHVADNNGPGIWFDHPLGENTIADNVVTRNEQGIFYEIADPQGHLKFGARIENNRVFGNRKQGIYVSASSGVVVKRNTLRDNWVNLALHGMPRSSFALRDNVVRDNIIGPAAHAQLIVYSGELAANNQVDGNFYAGEPGGPRIGVVRGRGYDVTHRDLNKLAADTGMEANGRVGDPRWRDADEGDFRLAPQSDAQGKGWSVDGE